MPEIWERQPIETPKAWAGFVIYRELPLNAPAGEDHRALSSVAKRLGHKDLQVVSKWSRFNNWVERATAYDDYKRNTAIAVRDVALAQYQQQVVARLTTNLTGYYELVEKTIRDMRLLPEGVAPGKLLMLGRAIRMADDLARRAGGMPVEFYREKVREQDFEGMTYTVEDES